MKIAKQELSVITSLTTTTITTDDCLSPIELFPSLPLDGQKHFCLEQLSGVLGIRQTKFSKEELIEFGQFLINYANENA